MKPKMWQYSTDCILESQIDCIGWNVVGKSFYSGNLKFSRSTKYILFTYSPNKSFIILSQILFKESITLMDMLPILCAVMLAIFRKRGPYINKL